MAPSRSRRPRSQHRSRRSSSADQLESGGGLWGLSRGMYLAVLLIAPWTFGGVHHRTQTYLFAGIISAGLIWVAAYLSSDERTQSRTRLPLLILPLVMGVIYASIHLVPIPDLAKETLGPSLAEEIPASSNVVGFQRNAISIYPLQTRMQIASLSIAVLAFFLSSQLFNSRRSQLWLFGALALTGLALSFFGLCQKLSWNGHLFWRGPEIIDGKPFAAWVNRNNAAGFLNITFAAALGMLLWATFRSLRRGEYEYDMLQDGIGGGISETINSYLIRIGQLTGWQMVSGTCIVVIAAGIIGSASRGGILSLLAGVSAALLWLLLKGHRHLAISIFLIFSIPAVGLLSWLGLSGDVKERFASSEVSDFSQSLRYQNWSEATRSLPEIWITGSGFGTYRYFYRPYQQHSAHGVYIHAENQYLETLIETGVIGVGLLLIVLLLSFMVILRLSRSKLIGEADPVALVGLVALVTQAVHAFLDYGLTVPSNMLLFATVMGAVAGRAVRKLAAGQGNWYFSLPELQPRIVFLLFGILLIGNGILGWGEISRAAVAEQAIKDSQRIDIDETSDEVYGLVVDNLLDAISRRPDDIHLHLHLADVYTRRYQSLTERMLKHQVTPDMKLSDLEIERLSGLSTLYKQVWRMEQAGQEVQLEVLRDDPIIKETLIPARSVLLTASSACEWLPQTELYLAYLSVLEEEPEERVARLQRLAYLTPYEPKYLNHVGKMSLIAGERELCLFAWQRTFQQTTHSHLRHQILKSLSDSKMGISLSDEFFRGDIGMIRLAVEDLSKMIGQDLLMGQCLIAIDHLMIDSRGLGSADLSYLDGFRRNWRGDYDGACNVLSESLSKGPEDRKAVALYVEALINAQRYQQAAEELEKISSDAVAMPDVKRLEKMLADASTNTEND